MITSYFVQSRINLLKKRERAAKLEARILMAIFVVSMIVVTVLSAVCV